MRRSAWPMRSASSCRRTIGEFTVYDGGKLQAAQDVVRLLSQLVVVLVTWPSPPPSPPSPSRAAGSAPPSLVAARCSGRLVADPPHAVRRRRHGPREGQARERRRGRPPARASARPALPGHGLDRGDRRSAGDHPVPGQPPAWRGGCAAQCPGPGRRSWPPLRPTRSSPRSSWSPSACSCSGRSTSVGWPRSCSWASPAP